MQVQLRNMYQTAEVFFLDNDVYNVFDKDFIGAEDFVTIDFVRLIMIYPENSDKGIKKIQLLFV